MDIPAIKICDQLEIQVSKLKSSILNEDNQSVSESLAVIEAYCQLLKSSSTKGVPQQPRPSFPQVAKQEYSIPAQTVSNVEQEVKGRNLLDF